MLCTRGRWDIEYQRTVIIMMMHCTSRHSPRVLCAIEMITIFAVFPRCQQDFCHQVYGHHVILCHECHLMPCMVVISAKIVRISGCGTFHRAITLLHFPTPQVASMDSHVTRFIQRLYHIDVSNLRSVISCYVCMSSHVISHVI